MSTTEMTVGEMSESLTGFDEIAIEKSLGIDPYTDGERKPVLLLRALVFVALRRNGLNDTDARQQTLAMPLSAVNAYFAEDDEPMPEAPVTEPGKGDFEPVTLPPS